MLLCYDGIIRAVILFIGSAGYGDDREDGFGEAAASGINLRGVSPDRLINAIKDAGLASALGMSGLVIFII